MQGAKSIQTFESVGERDEHVAAEAGLDDAHNLGAERLDLNHACIALALIEDACEWRLRELSGSGVMLCR